MIDPKPVNRPLVFLGITLLFVLLAALLARFGPRPTAAVPSSGVAPYTLPRRDGPDVDAAIEHLGLRLRRDPKSFLDRTELAGLYLRKAREGGGPGFFLLAEKEARTSLEGMPKFNDPAKLVLAGAAEARHDFPEALRLTDEVLAANPSDPEATAQKITILLARGDLQEAGVLADALVGRLMVQPTLNLRAQVRLARGDTKGALEDLRQGLKLEQADTLRVSARTRALMGRALAVQGRPKEAEEAFRVALDLDPDHTMALAGLAAVLEGSGRKDEALALYRRLQAVSPVWTVDVARLEPGQAEELLAEAETSLRKTLESEPTGHRRDLARVLLAQGQAEEAVDLLRQDLEVRRDGATLALYAEALDRAGRADEAAKARQEARDGGYAASDWEPDH